MPDAGKQAVSGIETREVIVQRLPAPDRLVLDWDRVPVCFITDDGTSLCWTLAENLTAQGWKAVVLQSPASESKPPSKLPQDVQAIQTQGMSEDHIEATLNQASKLYGPASDLVYLEPTATGSEPEQNLQTAFWLAKHLQPALTESSHGGRNAFLTVTRMDGALGTSGEGRWSAISGGLFGLVKTLNLEWEDVFCRALDIQPDLSIEQTAEVILAELEDPDRTIVEVGVGPQKRVTLTLSHAARSSS
jgi:hypothetical protein